MLGVLNKLKVTIDDVYNTDKIDEKIIKNLQKLKNI